jgi:hypothetical protein
VCLIAGDAVKGSVSLRIQQLDVSCETKTRDNVFVNIVVRPHYLIDLTFANSYGKAVNNAR